MKKNQVLKIVILIIVFIISAIIIAVKINQNKESNVEGQIIEQVEENQSTTQIPVLSHSEEESLEKESLEGYTNQENPAYNGDYISDNIQIGSYQGLTYYSQLDSRWKDQLYSVTGDSSQTIGVSGCGPTSAAMVVSSIKGTIAPNEMANLFIQNGFRSTNNGTYLSAFSWLADYFNMGFESTTSLNRVVELLQNNYYVVASCQSGLFTYGGHLIVLVGIDGDRIKVYDPYLYSGKFETSTRRGKCEVIGNTVYVSVNNFRNYASCTNFFTYKNDQTDIKDNNTQVNTSDYSRYVTANTGLNVRSGAGMEYNVVKALTKGSQVTIYENSGDWSRIGDNQWVYSEYLGEYNYSQSSNVSSNNNVKVIAKTGLNIRTAPGTSSKRVGGYEYGTVVTITSQSNGWGKTNKGWIYLAYTQNVTSDSSSSNRNTVGTVKRLKTNSSLYSGSNLNGTHYYYLRNSSFVVLQNVSSNVDKVKSRVTGRIAYVNINNYYK